MSKKTPILLTSGEYLEKVNAENLKDKKVTRQAIWLAAKEGNISLLPSVKKIHKAGRYFLFEISS